MGRSRTIGALLAALACAGVMAGCGSSDGFTASEETPAGGTSTTAAPTGAAAPAAQPDATSAVGVLAPSDPSRAVATFKGYDRFPKNRAGKIFIDPTVKKEPAPTSTLPGGTTSVPTTTGATTAPTTTTPTTTPKTTVLEATLEISGTSETAKVGSQVPAAAPQFTVESISTTTVTLKVNSGTLPGGGSTIDIDKGSSVTLSNPADGSSYVVKVLDIKQKESGA